MDLKLIFIFIHSPETYLDEMIETRDRIAFTYACLVYCI